MLSYALRQTDPLGVLAAGESRDGLDRRRVPDEGTPAPVDAAGASGPGSPADGEILDRGNELMLELKQGNRAALHRLFALYNGKLYNYIHRIVGDAESAEDIVQETWLSLYERREGYQPIHRFSTWLFTIARRKALSEIRRRKVRAVVRSLTAMAERRNGEEYEAPQRTFSDPDTVTDGRIVAAMVEKALARLSAPHREIIMLRDVEGFENEEIAEILGWSAKPGAIRKRVFDAREAFRKAMAELGYEEQR